MINQSPIKMRAVTLTEVIVVIVIIGIVASILGTVLRQVTLSYQMQEMNNETAWQARIALFRIERELGEATEIVSGSSTTSLNFTSPQTGNTVIYQRVGTALTRQENGGTSRALAEHVTGFTVGGLNSSFASTSTLSEIRCVTIALTVSYRGQTIPLNSVVCPRNLL